MFFKKYNSILLALVTTLFSSSLCAQISDKFKSPDAADRVITYWMFLNGNITKAGITKDLEAMKAAGVNGTLFFSVGIFKAGPVKFMSEPWLDAVGHAMKESDRLKMKFGIYNSDGWSMSGGPWISAEESMKQLVWTDTLIHGGKKVKLKLARPHSNKIYEDVSIIAFPAIENDRPVPVKGIVSSELITVLAKNDNMKASLQFQKAAGGKTPHVVFDFGKLTELRRVVVDGIKANPFLEASAKFEYSNDGKLYTPVEFNFPLNLKSESIVKQLTFTFPKVNARYIRMSVDFEASTKKPVPITQETVDVAHIQFYQSPRVNLWEPKSGESKRIRHERQKVFMHELNAISTENLPGSYTVSENKQIDLTALVDKDGILNWDAPKGEWIIQRIGYTSTNRMVGPATKEGRGFECNKMDTKAVEKHFNAYSGKLIDLSNKLLGRPLDYIQMESWEAGIQNWTKGFENEFEKRNGYSLIPYLPVLAGGYVVDSYETSNRFLWDFRNTVSQLIAENYWVTMYRMAKARGVTVSGEGSGMQHYLYDPMRYQQYLDIPMGEFWPNEGHVRADIKSSSSVAHTYGRALAGAEAFTSGYEDLWSVTPHDLKQIGDEAFTLGTNHIVLHTYVHQPFDIAPGYTLGKFGNHLQRLNPWYTRAKGWFDYLARSQYMLRLGKNIQDIAYFSGEGVPSYLGLPWELHPALADGFDYDGVNTDILKQMTVHHGQLQLPTGAAYKLLVFQDVTKMTPALANEIKRLVGDGATVISLKPVGSPSLSGNLSADNEVKQIADEVWGNIDGTNVKEHSYGKGRMLTGVPVEEVLKKMNALPDFIYKADEGESRINFVHKQTQDTDTYFLANYDRKNVKIKGTFRAGNKVPELWDPDKGTSVLLPYRIINEHQVEVPLDFEPLGSMFVVFKNTAGPKQVAEKEVREVAKYAIKGPWKVNFQTAADTVKTVFQTLSDWSENSDERIKYFSGTASYTQDIHIKKIKNGKVEIDLGQVNDNLATVKINGQEVAHLWKPPYKADVTSYLHKGKNQLEIVVTNTAVNSLVGDERFAPDVIYETNAYIKDFPSWVNNPAQRKSERKTFVTFQYLKKDSKLDPSGMQGPVILTFYK